MTTPSTAPCDLHELTGCSICSGLDKKLAAEDAQQTGPLTWDQVMALGSPPPGHTWAMWPGRCAGCGEPFSAGDPIRMSRTDGGWVAVGCC
jgi:hypothetical protein